MKSGNFVVDETIGISLLFASNFIKNPGKSLIITANLYTAQKVADLLASLIGEDKVLLFPIDDMLRSETLTSSKEILAQRLYVLSKSLENEPKIVVTHTSSLLTPISPIEDYKSSLMKFEVVKVSTKPAATSSFMISSHICSPKALRHPSGISSSSLYS